jgi:D-methionine transport system substrate-binding protein
MKKKILAGALAIITALSLAACGGSGSSAEKHDYVVGVASDQQKEIWEYVGDQVKKEGITIDVKLFSGYTEENPALVDGSLDLNSFQHVAYLNNFNKENNADLVPIGYTLISPFGLYSDKIKDYNDLKDGDTVAIPNDVTNGGRALQLLDAIGVIKLKSDAPDSPTTKDIDSYVKKITIKELQADQIAAALPDVTAATINTNYVTDQLHTTPKNSAIYIDTDHIDKVNDIYKNVMLFAKRTRTRLTSRRSSRPTRPMRWLN